ncbi:uncharacterized protein LOC143583119 [Bidens hawaiensis]|uniref:uncharacterized protein LOC143583119 n=1 Tax=Bidens hawaiensis TaxID=980011 RepID=UPI00404ABEB5
MGDTTPPPPPKGKENGPSSVHCPMLTAMNYTVWAMRMKVVLRVHKVWDTINSGVPDEDKNDMAMALLFQSIPETLIMQIGDQETVKAMWDSIKTRHLGAERVREARLQTLSVEFDNIKMNESNSIDNFAGKLSSIASKSASLGEVIDEARLVKKFLKSLPRSKYNQMVDSLQQVLDLNKTGFEDVVGRLRAYEERIREEKLQGGDQELNENITGRVKFGDGSFVQIKGKGSILFQGKSGDQDFLTEIYYIPELKNNIISIGQATESGCDIWMKHDLLTMYDENGRLLMKVKRSENRLFKIRMKIGAPVCLQSKIEDDAWRWHTRLGHINFELMKSMAKKDLVRGLPHVEHGNQLCESCLVGKQTRCSFPATSSF